MRAIEIFAVICGIQYILNAVIALLIGFNLTKRLNLLDSYNIERFHRVFIVSIITPCIGLVFSLWIIFALVYSLFKQKKLHSNHNGRVYSKSTIDDAIKKMAQNKNIGEISHPETEDEIYPVIDPVKMDKTFAPIQLLETDKTISTPPLTEADFVKYVKFAPVTQIETGRDNNTHLDIKSIDLIR